MLRVSVEELLLIAPKRIWSERCLLATALSYEPHETPTHEDEKHDELDPAKEQSYHHCHAQPR